MDRESNNINNSITVEKVIEIARVVVAKYVARGVVPSREKEDVVMSMVEHFIKQRKKIDATFEGKSKVTTYYTAILNRMCCEVIRKENKHWYAIVEGESNSKHEEISLPIESEKASVIRSEINRLGKTMIMLNGERAKTILFLKYFFDIPITENEIKEYCREKTTQFFPAFQKTSPEKKGDIFEKLAIVVNSVENKDVKADAVRMWLNKQIDTILARMNHCGATQHNKESLALLIEYGNTFELN
jgi:DNA-directed RNA polymerase specialized sigma24 family protein